MNHRLSTQQKALDVSRNMKRTFFILTLTLFIQILYSQALIDFGNFPGGQTDSTPVLTDNLLQKINWESIKKYCDTSKLHHATISKDSLLTIYEYVEQGRVSHFKITSYKGFVLQYDSEISSTSQPSSSSYFDKNVWMIYVSDELPDLPEIFKLTKEEPQTILKSYYRLLGVSTRDEYGWICEYSATGRATQKRLAVLELVKYQRIDLLKRLIDYSNVQTQLYAIDALIFLDLQTKNKIETAEKEIRQRNERLDSLMDLDNSKRNEIEGLQQSIKNTKGYIKYLENHLLTKKTWKGIHELRDSNKEVKTCRDGSGSYKVYESNTSELLSDKAINEIPGKYENLKRLGYL